MKNEPTGEDFLFSFFCTVAAGRNWLDQRRSSAYLRPTEEHGTVRCFTRHVKADQWNVPPRLLHPPCNQHTFSPRAIKRARPVQHFNEVSTRMNERSARSSSLQHSQQIQQIPSFNVCVRARQVELNFVFPREFSFLRKVDKLHQVFLFSGDLKMHTECVCDVDLPSVS